MNDINNLLDVGSDEMMMMMMMMWVWVWVIWKMW